MLFPLPIYAISKVTVPCSFTSISGKTCKLYPFFFLQRAGVAVMCCYLFVKGTAPVLYTTLDANKRKGACFGLVNGASVFAVTSSSSADCES